ncbi:Flp family type IVb pilin [Ochrobactrum sp. MR28]|nr:Flp family type IVb pilin [Ochrobactrum sp. MR28]MBX8816135.1 Flp family type IVb pilin [Ochrobactrum sp. MR31]
MKIIFFLRTQAGATSIEYSLIAAFIALIIVGSLLALGPKINKPLETVSDTLQNSIN